MCQRWGQGKQSSMFFGNKTTFYLTFFFFLGFVCLLVLPARTYKPTCKFSEFCNEGVLQSSAIYKWQSMHYISRQVTIPGFQSNKELYRWSSHLRRWMVDVWMADVPEIQTGQFSRFLDIKKKKVWTQKLDRLVLWKHTHTHTHTHTPLS